MTSEKTLPLRLSEREVHRRRDGNDDGADDDDTDNDGGVGGMAAERKGDAAMTINAGCSIPIGVRTPYSGRSGD